MSYYGEASPVLTTETLAYAVPFKQLDADLSIRYDSHAAKVLGEDYWRVMDAFKYYIGNKANNVWVHVPAGFLTDGASVPRPFWSLLPPWSNYGQAAVIHDILCETLTVYMDGQPIQITRKRADRIFREAMKVAGVGSFKRNLMYYCVWAFSLLKYKPNAKRLAIKQQLEKDWV